MEDLWQEAIYFQHGVQAAPFRGVGRVQSLAVSSLWNAMGHQGNMHDFEISPIVVSPAIPHKNEERKK